MKYRTLIGRILFAVLFFAPLATQAQFWRVIKRIDDNAQPHGTQNYVMSDSTLFEYDANTMRGSNYTNDTIDYRLCYHYQQDGQKRISLYRRTYCTYDINDRLYTRAVHDANGVWERDTFFYRPNTALIDSHRFYNIGYFSGNPVLIFQVLYKYDHNANGQLTRIVTDRMRTFFAYPEPYKEDLYFYDTAGRLVQQLTRELDMSSLTWQDKTRRLYDYDSNGNQTSISRYDIDVMKNKIELSFKKVSFYDTNNMLIVDSIFTKVLDSTTYFEAHAYTYDSLDRLLTDTLYYTVYNTMEVTMYSYTTFGHLDEINVAVGSAGNLNLGYRSRFTYEEYGPVNVPELYADNNNEVTLYPNPAINMLHIATGEAYKQGRIYNSMGQMVQVVNANSKQVNISQLPAGNYYLQLTINDKTMSKRFTVVR